jgi:hypothetical protein
VPPSYEGAAELELLLDVVVLELLFEPDVLVVVLLELLLLPLLLLWPLVLVVLEVLLPVPVDELLEQ